MAVAAGMVKAGGAEQKEEEEEKEEGRMTVEVAAGSARAAVASNE